MAEKKKPGNRRIQMGDKGNYNESIARDYVENNYYNINISQDKTSQVPINNSKKRQSDALNNVKIQVGVKKREKYR